MDLVLDAFNYAHGMWLMVLDNYTVWEIAVGALVGYVLLKAVVGFVGGK